MREHVNLRLFGLLPLCSLIGAKVSDDTGEQALGQVESAEVVDGDVVVTVALSDAGEDWVQDRAGRFSVGYVEPEEIEAEPPRSPPVGTKLARRLERGRRGRRG